MANEEKKAEETSGDQSAGGAAGMDRNEGQTLNGTVGGTGSDLENASARLGGTENDGSKQKKSSEALADTADAGS